MPSQEESNRNSTILSSSLFIQKKAAKALLFMHLKGIWNVCLTGQIEKEGFSCRD
jgi:hypothetical protein